MDLEDGLFYLVQLNPNYISEHLLTLQSSQRLLLSNNIYSIETTSTKNITAASISEYLHYCSKNSRTFGSGIPLKLVQNLVEQNCNYCFLSIQ